MCAENKKMNKNLSEYEEYDNLAEFDRDCDGECGNSANHNNGETEGCAECAAIKLNI